MVQVWRRLILWIPNPTDIGGRLYFLSSFCYPSAITGTKLSCSCTSPFIQHTFFVCPVIQLVYKSGNQQYPCHRSYGNTSLIGPDISSIPRSFTYTEKKSHTVTTQKNAASPELLAILSYTFAQVGSIYLSFQPSHSPKALFIG